MCFYKNFHSGHKIIDINDEEDLKKENLILKDSSENIEDSKSKIEKLKIKIENEMSKLDTRFQTGWNYVALNHDDINKYNDIFN